MNEGEDRQVERNGDYKRIRLSYGRRTSAFKYYPDLEKRTCVADGEEGEYQPNLYDTLEECVSCPSTYYAVCTSTALSHMPI